MKYLTSKSIERKRSLDWFKTLLRDSVKGQNVQYFNPAEDVLIGRLFLYQYDPKYKEKLPIYDVFPLVMPFTITENGFIGINFHFLDPSIRQGLIKLILKHNSDKFSYALLQKLVKSDQLAGSIKRYLVDHIESRLIKVDKPQWHNVVNLPLAKMIRK